MFIASFFLPGISEAQCPATLNITNEGFDVCGYQKIKIAVNSASLEKIKSINVQIFLNTSAIYNGTAMQTSKSGIFSNSCTLLFNQNSNLITFSGSTLNPFEFVEFQNLLTLFTIFLEPGVLPPNCRFVETAQVIITKEDGSFCSMPSNGNGMSCFIPNSINGTVEKFPVGCANGLNNGLNLVNVKLNETINSLTISDVFTDLSGQYFSNGILDGCYEHCLVKNTNVNCGLNSIDLTLIRNIILGVTACFPQAWQSIAADANDDQAITTGDINIINKWILGQAPSNPYRPWKFIKVSSGLFNQLNNALETCLESTPLVPTCWSVNSTATSSINDYVGIKVGDVNGSCTNCAGFQTPNNSITRSNSNLELVFEEKIINNNKILQLDLSKLNNIVTLSSELKINLDEYKFASCYVSGIVDNGPIFNYSYLSKEGILQFSLIEVQGGKLKGKLNIELQKTNPNKDVELPFHLNDSNNEMNVGVSQDLNTYNLSIKIENSLHNEINIVNNLIEDKLLINRVGAKYELPYIIMNMEGKVLEKAILIPYENLINLNQLLPGIYIISAKNEETNINQKFVKK